MQNVESNVERVTSRAWGNRRYLQATLLPNNAYASHCYALRNLRLTTTDTTLLTNFPAELLLKLLQSCYARECRSFETSV